MTETHLFFCIFSAGVQLGFCLHGVRLFSPNTRTWCCVKSWPGREPGTCPGRISVSWCLQGQAAEPPWPWSGGSGGQQKTAPSRVRRRDWRFNFVNFSPPFNILSRLLKAARSMCHYLQQPVAYCNSSLQSWEDVFEFIIAAESASNLPLERRSVRAGSVCAHPQ